LIEEGGHAGVGIALLAIPEVEIERAVALGDEQLGGELFDEPGRIFEMDAQSG